MRAAGWIERMEWQEVDRLAWPVKSKGAAANALDSWIGTNRWFGLEGKTRPKSHPPADGTHGELMEARPGCFSPDTAPLGSSQTQHWRRNWLGRNIANHSISHGQECLKGATKATTSSETHDSTCIVNLQGHVLFTTVNMKHSTNTDSPTTACSLLARQGPHPTSAAAAPPT